MVFERAKRASLELGDQVVFHEINTFNKEVCDDWGISDSLFINRKKVNTGPPPSYKKIKKKISKQLKKCIISVLLYFQQVTPWKKGKNYEE
jgi:hypothetical protein